jgi:hypothetical protein
MAVEFHQTVMGRRFFEGTIPNLVRALERIARVLETQHPAPPTPQGLQTKLAKEELWTVFAAVNSLFSHCATEAFSRQEQELLLSAHTKLRCLVETPFEKKG